MVDRPLLFQPAMVRALLDGTKIQTRRLLKNAEHWGCPTGDCPHSKQTECEESMAALDPKDIGYAVGDRIWVKETWHTAQAYDHLPPSALSGEEGIWYPADSSFVRWGTAFVGKKRVSIHMTRWASRITLNVTDVRVEPLLNINRGDAMAEGCPFPNMADGPDPREWYRHLWNEINGEVSWEANPWVVAISFDVLKRNIDQ